MSSSSVSYECIFICFFDILNAEGIFFNKKDSENLQLFNLLNISRNFKLGL